VPERHGAAVHVHARPVPAECLAVGQRLHGERFVRFDEIVIGNRRAGLLHQMLYRDDRRKEDILRLAAAGGVARDLRHRLQAVTVGKGQ
jgi:hypothetical protein